LKLLIVSAFLFLVCLSNSLAQTHCRNTPARSWWDVLHYDLTVQFDLTSAKINGHNIIKAKALKDAQSVMELDLQLPMVVDSVLIAHQVLGTVGDPIPFIQEDNVCFIMLPYASLAEGQEFKIKVFFHGRPIEAANAPWDGGMVSRKDAQGNAWLAMACQGIGASVWWPCKDIATDEAEEGVSMRYIVPNGYTAIGNGRLVATRPLAKTGYTEWHWQTIHPINNYSVTFYIGKYESWQEQYKGEGGSMPITYYVLKGNKQKAAKHFRPMHSILHALEYWMGPYPFYADGFKLVEAPYLGMEHQSAIAWGNNYQMGYEGRDRSGSGYGLLFDFLMVHETAHEWFGNSLTASSPAEAWIQEGFTSYAETLFLEQIADKQKAFAYQHGKWQNIKNDIPVQGSYDLCTEGSTDQYDKAGAMIHTIRVLMNNDSLFRQMLRQLQSTYQHQIVTAFDIRTFIHQFSGLNLDKLFDQYLLHTDLPVLAFRHTNEGVQLRWERAVAGFDMPVRLYVSKQDLWLQPDETWRTVPQATSLHDIKLDDAFLISIIGLNQ
jgi:aminopeptidase N